MNWPKIRYAVWILGFLFLAWSAISFLLEISQDAKNKSGGELWLLGIGSVFGVAIVLAFWSRKWYQTRDYFQGKLPFPTGKIVLRAGGIIALFVFAFVLVTAIHLFIDSAPEFAESEDVIKSNAAVLSKFGSITEMKTDDSGNRFEMRGNTRSGTYEFKVQGTSREGVLRIKWEDQDGKFTPLEIDEVVLPETVTALWVQIEENTH